MRPAADAALDATTNDAEAPVDIARDGHPDAVWDAFISEPTTPVCMISATLRVGIGALLRQGVAVELREPNPSTFAMQGERDVGNTGTGSKTLLAGDDPTDADGVGGRMLEIRGIPPFSLRNVNLDGGQVVETLLYLEPGGGPPQESGYCEVSDSALHGLASSEGATLVQIVGTSARRVASACASPSPAASSHRTRRLWTP